jgi:hypothetical protein
MASPERRYWLDDRRNVKKVIYALFAVCGLLVVLDLFVHRHVDHGLEQVPAFYALYGFICCVFLVLAAKELRKIIRRKEDYYDDK